MECNRDEAVRAKEIAERLFAVKDIEGAKKFALKARNLYPDLDGISQMLMTLEIYLCAQEKKIQEEYDWYGVLGVNPFADDETIRKQYRKLALLLHPDKNRFIGAEGAFQLVSQAWNLLSDKSRRTAYDRRYGMTFQQRDQSTKVNPSRPMQNGFYKFAKTAASLPRGPNCDSNKMNRIPKANSSNRNGLPKDKCHGRDGVTNADNTIKSNLSSGPPPFLKERHTFWTVCDRCRMQYEYLRVYLNHHLLCPNCHEAYFAIEIEPPSSRGSKRLSSQSASSKLWKNTGHQGTSTITNHSVATHTGTPGFSRNNERNHGNFQWTPLSESTGSATAFQAANMVKQAYEKVKKERQKAQAATRRGETLRGKNHASKRPVDTEMAGLSDAVKRRKGVDSFGNSMETTKHGICEIGTVRVTNFSTVKQDSLKKHTSHHLLMEKGRKEILKKLNEPMPDNMMNPEADEVHENTKENGMANTNNGSCTHAAKLRKPVETNTRVPLNNLCHRASGPSGEQVGQILVDVPDPDFRGFDKDRIVQCFKDNQVWAVYDDDDGMPRHYTMIHSVISLYPFKMRLSWLNSMTNDGLGHVNWFINGFSKTCGEFRTGRLDICTSLDCFSHKVRFVKCTPETVQIFPQRGDVWALYRNWSSDWNELTEDEVIHKYDMVEVLEDYVEEYGVIVVPLVKVSGFKAVFHQHFNPDRIWRIPVEEMARFSHQVPSNLLTGGEGAKVLKGCRELDPASIPLEILQALPDVEGINFLEAENNSESVKVVDCDGNASTNVVDDEVSQIQGTELLRENEG
ncbi:hypothetical protein F511_10758 [Dorcoceras hygrometricum]|uniref:J domain-containing protein n=1 Tax=Dorcoceras hygrometricum TaxID=472368 RepID=A0A2Z7CE09_9LAMI|nr:hypothetical protein F511_10758 [Dorcoceras hygrometricum]